MLYNSITMSLSLKQYKENEHRMHELLYNNVLLLTNFYPVSKEFDAQFKRDMFLKNNKAAFYEVAYYLLNILNPNLTKKKLTTWPPFDIKRENKFRTELLKYINELNSLYDSADIPTLMASNLISPGGYKFVQFMLKLSKLVLFEHLKLNNEDMLYPLKAGKIVELNKVKINLLKKKTALIEVETTEMLKEYEEFHAEANDKSCKIVVEQTELNTVIRDLKEELQTVEKGFHEKHTTFPCLENLQKTLLKLKEESIFSHEINKLLTETENLISYLSGNDLLLEHDKSELLIPNEISHLINNGETLDLTQFFHGLQVLLERKTLELPNPTSLFLSNALEKVTQLNRKLTDLEERLLEEEEGIVSIPKLNIISPP